MKRLFLWLSALFSATHFREDEIESIKMVFKKGVDAWNRGDIDGHLESYANLETIRLISAGQVTVGKEAVDKALKSRFATSEQMGTLSTRNLQIEILTASDALFFGEFHLERDSMVSSGVFSGHMKKFFDGWAIVLDHSSALD